MSADDADLQDTFRKAMRRVAATVSVVSVQRGGERHGTTATSLTSISMDPPSVLVCFNKAGRLHDFLHNGDSFCVSVLHTDNLETSRAFAGPMSAAERFAVGDWKTDPDGTLYLADAQANLFCVKELEVEYGSHTIFIGRVERAMVRDDVAPLLYSDGAYASCGGLIPLTKAAAKP
jgi:flavin reductase